VPVASILTASVLSGITDLLTTVVGDYGFYAVFLLMLLDAVFPAASEPVMVYGGAVAAGAFAGQDVQLSPGRSATRSARWVAGGSAPTAAGRSSSATAAGCT
jgi:hypothetical protein